MTVPGASPRGRLGWTCPPHFCQTPVIGSRSALAPHFLTWRRPWAVLAARAYTVRVGSAYVRDTIRCDVESVVVLSVQYFAGERQHDAEPLPPRDPRQARRRLRRHSGATSVPLAYVPGPWSACTRACGGAGLQSRHVACEVRGTPDYQLAVDERYCATRELMKPNDMQDCGYVMCPMWEAGPWSQVANIQSTSVITVVINN